jgi:hypothetical protein
MDAQREDTTMTGYCGHHRSEGCPKCREESILELTNRVYDRHCGGKIKREDARLVIVIGVFFVLLLVL